MAVKKTINKVALPTPTVKLDAAADTLAAGGKVLLTFTFSTPPSGFSLADIKATNALVSRLTKVSPEVYTAELGAVGDITSRHIAVQLNGAYSNGDGKSGAPSNTVTLKYADAAPVLKGLSFAATVNVSRGAAEQAFTVTASDESGVREVVIRTDKGLLTADGLTQEIHVGAGADSFIDNTPGRAKSGVMVQKYTTPGEYKIVGVDVVDTTGAVRSYDAAQLKAAGFKTSFKVSGAIDDKTAPVLKGLNLPAEIDIGKGVTKAMFGATVLDDTGVQGVVIRTDRAVGVEGGAALAIGATGDTYIDNTPNYGAVGRTFGPGSATGVYNITEVEVTDRSGKVAVYNAQALQQMGIASSFTVKDSAEPLKVALSSDVATVGDQGKALLTFAFSGEPVGFTLDDIKVTNGVVSKLVQSATDPRVYTAEFVPTQNASSNVSTIKLDGAYADASGKAGTPSNTVTVMNSAPTLEGFTFDPVIDVSNGAKAQKFTATAYDASGIFNVYVYTDKVMVGEVWALNSLAFGGDRDNFRDATPYTATATQNLQPYTANGTYHVTMVSVRDNAGNYRNYTEADLQAQGLRTTFEVIGARPDVAKPVLTGLQLPTVIDLSAGSKLVTFGATATDDSSGVKEIRLKTDKILSTSNGSGPMISGSTQWLSVGTVGDTFADATPGSGALATTVYNFTDNGVYNILEAQVIDKTGKTQVYSGAALASLGIANSFAVTGSTPDHAGPTLKGLTLPTLLDVSGGSAAFTIGVTAEDSSGIHRVAVRTDKYVTTANAPVNYFYTSAGSNPYNTDSTPDYGSISYTMQKNTLPGRYSVTEIELTDKAGNVRVYARAELEALGIRTTFDVQGALGDEVAPVLGGGKASIVMGTYGVDTLGGTAGGDFIDGKSGADKMTGFAGDDLFAFAATYAASTVDGAASIADFKDGVDRTGLAGGLKFADLVVAQGSGAHAEDTIVSLAGSGNTLVVLTGVQATGITAGDFVLLA